MVGLLTNHVRFPVQVYMVWRSLCIFFWYVFYIWPCKIARFIWDCKEIYRENGAGLHCL